MLLSSVYKHSIAEKPVPSLLTPVKWNSYTTYLKIPNENYPTVNRQHTVVLYSTHTTGGRGDHNPSFALHVCSSRKISLKSKMPVALLGLRSVLKTYIWLKDLLNSPLKRGTKARLNGQPSTRRLTKILSVTHIVVKLRAWEEFALNLASY